MSSNSGYMLSMTGFGSASCEAPCGKVTIEIQSVNRKFLDISLSLPKELSCLEPEIRTWIGKRVGRGQVTLRLYLIPQKGSSFFPDLEELKSLKKGWEKLALGLGLNPAQIDLPFLLLHAPLMQKEVSLSNDDNQAIQSCLELAFRHLFEMKKREGAALQSDLKERLRKIEEHLGAVERLAPRSCEAMRQKFQEKIEGLAAHLKGEALDEQIGRELFFFAEKVDIAEEVTRLKSHFLQMETMSSGKKIEFLLQEMGREINTIGSKVLDSEIAHLIVEMKGELEKMKEQVQNLE